jgi:xanthine dehydrogenase accessory factor
MMVIDDQGNIEGSITGGCVEGAIVTEAEELLAASGAAPAPAKLLRYGISDELAGTVGLMCGGIVHILVYELTGEAAEVERVALEAHAEGRPAAVATLIDGDTAGSRLAVIGDTLIGSLHDTDLLDRNVAREAQGLLEEGKTTLRRFGSDGATLGDDVRVHIRAYALPPQMWIIGAIDFSAALAPFASQIGYEVTITDARDRFARSRRFSAAASVKIGWPQEVMADVELGPRDAVLVFTHDPKFDEPALIAALRSGAGYVGALGSRLTHRERLARLREAGVEEAELDRISSPCGLDIGARTPAETAVSILAEVIAKRARRGGESLSDTGASIHPRELQAT